MATRLYFTSNAFSGPVYPPDANWNDVTQSTTQSSDMSSTPTGDAPYQQTAQKNSGANPHAILHTRFKLALPTGITLQGTIRGQFFAQCPGTLGGMRAISVRVFDSGTTLRANLLQHFPGVLASGFGNTTQNRNFPPSATITTPYTTVAGDVLVVEIGTQWFTGASGGTVTAAIRFGDAGSVDLPVDETTGVAAPEQNGWLEFESVNLFGKPDPFLLTLSGADNVVRPAAPDVRGLHFVDIATRSMSFWDGTSWKRLFQESLATLADRTKLLTLSDGNGGVGFPGPQLVPGGSWGGTGIGIFAPSGTVAFVVGPNGTMGRGLYSDTDLMRHDSVTINSATRVRGWNLQGLFASGTGGITGVSCTVGDSASAASTNEIVCSEWIPRASSANANGIIIGVRAQQGSYTGASATRGLVRLFEAKSLTSYVNQTIPSLAFYSISTAPIAGGTISGSCVGFKQEVIFGLGTTRRGGQFINSVEIIANPSGGAAVGRFQVGVFDRGYIYKDNQGAPHFWEMKGLADGTPQILDLGTTQPTT
jgi:hypothetical protein